MFLGLRWFTYDFEVFSHNWLVDFKEMEGSHLVIDDRDDLREFMVENRDAIFCGFNTKNYDRFIMTATIHEGDEPSEVKSVNDFIIAGNSGWEHRLMQDRFFWFNNVDVMDDMQDGQSLKSLEGQMFMNIQETEVDFNLDRPLTDEEKQQTIRYCQHDVEATEEITKLRKAYFQTKIDIGAMAGIPPEKALAMTNAKLTAAFLGAELPEKPWQDEREYKYPANLKTKYVPAAVLQFFDRMKDPTIPDEILWKTKLNLNIGGTPTTVGFGGVHAAIPNYIFKQGE